MSLRFRLTLWVVALFVLLKLLLVGIFWLYLRGSLLESFDSQLMARAASMATDISSELPNLTQEELNKIAQAQLKFVQFTSFRIIVVGPDGSDWTKSGLEWPAKVMDIGRTTVTDRTPHFITVNTDWFLEEENPSTETRVVSIPIRGTLGNPYALVVATGTSFVRSQVALIVQTMVLTTVVGLFASAISGWYIAGLATAPIEEMRELTSKLTPESLATRIDVRKSGPEMKRLVEALNGARMRMRTAFEVQERFLSNVSHEIKTPIATLLVEAQTMDRSSLPKHGQGFVKTAEEEMRRLGKLVESFLTLTRIRDGKGTPTLSKLLVNELLLDSVMHCTPMAKQYYVRLEPIILDSDDTLDTTIEGDNDLLRTLLDNLVRNAIRFTPENGVIRVFALVKDADHVEFLVRDEGPGLPPAMLETAFDRFVQAPDEVRRGRGHGLGLSIAQAVAELHGGSIVVRNCDPKGAEFRVTLPRVQSKVKRAS